jgi:hypothetical protein
MSLYCASLNKINLNAVRILIEPLIFVIAGCALYHANNLLSLWLQFAGMCLFYKELSSYWHFKNRVMDSIDARLEGERIGAVVRQQTAPQRNGRQEVSTVTMAEPSRPPADSIPQMYSNLDPALRRLVGTPDQSHPNSAPANRPSAPLVVVRNRRGQPERRLGNAPH